MLSVSVNMRIMSQETLVDDDVKAELRRRIEASGVRSLAAELGFSPGFISHVANGKRRLTENLANRLGFELVSKPSRVWRKADPK